jgi:hypothetical protein
MFAVDSNRLDCFVRRRQVWALFRIGVGSFHPDG